MAHGRNKYQSRENRARIRDLLMREWDPIGVSEIPGAEDEYDSYIGKVYAMLMDQRANAEEIAAYLFNVAVSGMGLSAYEMLAESSVRAASGLIALRSEFETH
jgi:hypothetical protein